MFHTATEATPCNPSTPFDSADPKRVLDGSAETKPLLLGGPTQAFGVITLKCKIKSALSTSLAAGFRPSSTWSFTSFHSTEQGLSCSDLFFDLLYLLFT